MSNWVYILRCEDNSYYTGSTNNLLLRMEQHFDENGGCSYTQKHKAKEIVYLECFERIDEAYFRERQIHGWSRIKKEALINNCQEDIPAIIKHEKERRNKKNSSG